jgi:hypothetical protein
MMKKIIIGIILGLIIIYSSLTLFGGAILRSSFPEQIEYVVKSFFPPKDLYRLLTKVEVDFKQGEFTLKENVIHKYPGRYEFGLILQDKPNDFYFNKNLHHLTSDMKVVFFVNGVKYKSYMLSGEFDPFIGKDGNGLILGVYNCPIDLPIDKLVTVEITIFGTSSSDKIKQLASFYIKKFSDK